MAPYALRKVAKGRWPSIRRAALRERGSACEICGFVAQETRNIHAHEVYAYDAQSKVVSFGGVQLLCAWCHNCKDFAHFQRMEQVGLGGKLTSEFLIAHYCRINQCSRRTFDRHLKDAWQTKIKLEMAFGQDVKQEQIHYGEYHDRVMASIANRGMMRDTGEFFDPLPGHELVYAPDGQLYGHRERLD
jgi:hypothetical protein